VTVVHIPQPHVQSVKLQARDIMRESAQRGLLYQLTCILTLHLTSQATSRTVLGVIVWKIVRFRTAGDG